MLVTWLVPVLRPVATVTGPALSVRSTTLRSKLPVPMLVASTRKSPYWNTGWVVEPCSSTIRSNSKKPSTPPSLNAPIVPESK